MWRFTEPSGQLARCAAIVAMLALVVALRPGSAAGHTSKKSRSVTVYSFGGKGSPSDDGVVPKGSLTDVGGILFGRTTATEETADSNNPTGVVFEFDPGAAAGANYSIIHSFAGATADGADPRHDAMTVYGNLLLGATQSGGSGTNTSCGGSIGCGTIYSIDLTNPAAPLYCLVHSFTGEDSADPSLSDGAQEHSSFVFDSNGVLYSQTALGGASNHGVIYKLVPDPAGICGFDEQVLYSFGKKTGEEPHGRLAISADGSVLYGMTRKGGANSVGVIFEYAIGTGLYCVLHDFGGCAQSDGAQTDHGYLTMAGSTLYGLTTFGGTHGCGSTGKKNPPGDGILFAIEPPAPGATCPAQSSVTYQILHDFGDSKHDGRNPYGSLLASGSDLYGTTAGGGSCKQGTVFVLAIDGSNPLKVSKYSRLHSFCYHKKKKNPDGAKPIDNVVLVNGTLYGMTSAGGAGTTVKGGNGTIFALP
jgi:uncharacterized repeat protein (TIGR03803 family)